jgi:hypothetical protein
MAQSDIPSAGTPWQEQGVTRYLMWGSLIRQNPNRNFKHGAHDRFRLQSMGRSRNLKLTSPFQISPETRHAGLHHLL